VINQARAVQERRASTASKSVLPPF
jgi:hypothetical protein